MEFHPGKCQVISITRKRKIIKHDYQLHNHTLEPVKSAKYLGCTINNHLDWGEHISNICNKANRNLSFIRRNLNIASTSVKETVYKSLVRPTVEYASTVWDPYEKGDINKLEMVQRRGVRYVRSRYHNRSSVADMMAGLHWKTLQQRRKEARLAMLFKMSNNLVTASSGDRLTRKDLTNNSRFHIPFCRTLYRQQSFYPRTIREWNVLPDHIWSAKSVDAFRTQLANHLM